MREINVSEITDNIKELCIKANHFLSPDMTKALNCAVAQEESAGHDTDLPGYRNGGGIY